MVCLIEETVDPLPARRVGSHISGFCVRPRRVGKSPASPPSPRPNLPKLLDLGPDLVIAFSDLQAGIVEALIQHGIVVHASTSAASREIFEMIRRLGAIVGAPEPAEGPAKKLEREPRGRSHSSQTSAPTAACVLRGTGRADDLWPCPLSELINPAGGIDIFADRARGKSAQDRVATVPEVVARTPDLIVGSWCDA